MTDCPLARHSELLVQELGDELLVFDELAHRAHSLNATATTVWQACDGTRTTEQLAAHCQLDPLVIDLALQDLAASQLLAGSNPPADRVTRRTVLRRTALAGAGLGIALPVIRSITAPSQALAASHGRVKGNAGNQCTRNSQCTPVDSFCDSLTSSCQRGISASCSHTSSCFHRPGDSAGVCRNGECGKCSRDSQCPPGYPSCNTGYCFAV